MQNGVSYTPGQLLAVVAPRTVLVVDAPTDWSLAGPLWELALDDAPIDEILDVLVRRGIRTSPSFAIVRLEGEAVRALVRGSVPVCFERTGEPVRLDATGATTWLEGLISGATRVLVGGIEQRTELPYLVDAGVVLVGGLALPTANARPETSGEGSYPQARSAAGSDDVRLEYDGQAGSDSDLPSGTTEPVVASSEAAPPVPVAAAAAEEAAGEELPARPPRVVDLTRSAPHTGSRAIIGAAGAAAGLAAAGTAVVGTAVVGAAAGLAGGAPEALAPAPTPPKPATRDDELPTLNGPAVAPVATAAPAAPVSNPFAPFEDPADEFPDEHSEQAGGARVLDLVELEKAAGPVDPGTGDDLAAGEPEGESVAETGPDAYPSEGTDVEAEPAELAEFADEPSGQVDDELDDGPEQPALADVDAQPDGDVQPDGDIQADGAAQPDVDVQPDVETSADTGSGFDLFSDDVDGPGHLADSDDSFLNPPGITSTGRGAYAPPAWSLTGGAAAAWGLPELPEPPAEPAEPAAEPRAESLAEPAPESPVAELVAEPPAAESSVVEPVAELDAEPFAESRDEAEPENAGHRFEPSPLNAGAVPGPDEPASPEAEPDAVAGQPGNDLPFADVIFGGLSELDGEQPAAASLADGSERAGSESDADAVDPDAVDADDLLLNGSARGPLPTALPNFDPPSVSLDLAHLRGRAGAPVRGTGAPDRSEAPLADRDFATDFLGLPARLPAGLPAGFGADAGLDEENTIVTEVVPQSASTADERVEESFEDYVRSRSRDLEDDEPAALPFRVRGQTLRPEHQIPFGGLRSNNGSWPRADQSGADHSRADQLGAGQGAEPGADQFDRLGADAFADRPADLAGADPDAPDEAGFRASEGFFDAAGESPFIPKPSSLNGVNGHRRERSESPAPEAGSGTPAGEDESEGLLLPAFFRGARAARSKTTDPVSPDHPAPVWARGNNGSNGERQRLNGPAGLRGSGQLGSQLNGTPSLGQHLGSGQGGPGTGLAGPGGGFGSGLGIGPQGRDGGPSVFTPPGGAPPPVPPREPPRLLGVWCDAGHVTSPDQVECRVCGLRVPPQAPILVARPPLGVLIFDNGDRVEVDRPVILGRDPKPVPSPDPESPVLHAVSSRTGQVSRTHAEIRASGWDVVLTDLDAMNGTTLTSPGGSPFAIEPGVPTVITSGSRADLGGESGFVFEVEG